MHMPGTRPCNCEHEFADHDPVGGCHMCLCQKYSPIPRSELRRRQFERGREEAEAKADHANKTELKSQDFPTTSEGDHRFWVDQEKHVSDVVTEIMPFGVVVGEHPVVDNRTGGTPTWMTYRTRLGAEKGRGRASVEIPEATVAEYQGKYGS